MHAPLFLFILCMYNVYTHTQNVHHKKNVEHKNGNGKDRTCSNKTRRRTEEHNKKKVEKKDKNIILL